MASKRELFKAAMAEVRAGKPRQDVFNTYQSQVSPDKHLAFAIASVADPERIKLGDKYNKILFWLLVFAAVTKGLTAFAIFGESFVGGLFMLVLGLFVPVVFAIAVKKYEGQVYTFLILLAGLGSLNALLKIGKEGAWMLLDVALLCAILWLALQVKRTVFPNMHWASVKKDEQGNYLW